ncbi:trimeric intracellular cation channel family protein [Peribacillus loiseleuriae]|uniref:trimeric intracellular cation channel family protein n=1 Tax=Peribacillus loiseleuriae TaxID=1679170 RepID=UPI0038116DD5
MTWEILTIIGTIAFAISGAIIAMEEEYDILGVYILGVVTAFGGGALRNLLIGVPVSALWDQGTNFIIAIVSITIVFLFPKNLIKHWKTWGNFTDAIGLSAFAIQGALYAIDLNRPLSAILVAAVLTGCGGGMIRDLLANRNPLVLKDEIYALWAIICGLFIGLNSSTEPWQLYSLFLAITALRVLSYSYNWKLPTRNIKQFS